MAWYYGTYSCGHEGRTNIVGPVKHREWKCEKHFEKLCPECWEKQLQEERDKANAEAAEKAKEMELPELTGTEKQVAWANTLRQNRIEAIEGLGKRELECIGSNEKEKHDIIDYLISHTSSSWFIDNRKSLLYWLEEKLPEIRKYKTDLIEKPLIEEIKQESTVWPENCQYKEAAEIKVDDSKVSVLFPKNEEFRKIVKSIGYSWDGYWYRKIDKFNGPASDRAAELGNKLLNAGFPITITDPIILQNAVSGNYQPEQQRWIYKRTTGGYSGWFAIEWGCKDNKLYNVARKLPGSKWSNPSVVIKINYYDEVEEFARLYGFKLSEGAIEAIEAYKNSLNHVEVVVPAKVEQEEHKDGLKEILNSGDEILADLKD